MQPLIGMRIVNMAVNLPGPAAAQRLRELGAEVVKIEPPAGDPMQLYSSAWYERLKAGQELKILDLKAAADRERFDELLAGSDLLITATRPAALARLDLDWESLHRRFPRLCQVAITGYPAPRENEPGHDLTYQAKIGLLTPPAMPRTLLADMSGAEKTVSAALALLLERERNGDAGYAAIPLSEAADFMAEPWRMGVTAAGTLLGGGAAEYNIYQAQDGWLAVAALEPHFRERLFETLESRPAGADDLRPIFLSKTVAHWLQWARDLDLPVAAVVDSTKT